MSKLPVILSLLILTVLLLANCAINTRGSDQSFCVLYEPIYYTATDDKFTKRDIDRNNLAWECLCNHEIDMCGKAGL